MNFSSWRKWPTSQIFVARETVLRATLATLYGAIFGRVLKVGLSFVTCA